MTLADVSYNLITGIGPLGNNPTSDPNIALGRFESLISMIIGIMTMVGGIWFTFQILMGAFQWITAGSDKDAVSKAQKRFTNALIGLIVLIFSYTFVALIGSMLGLNIFKFKDTVINIVG